MNGLLIYAWEYRARDAMVVGQVGGRSKIAISGTLKPVLQELEERLEIQAEASRSKTSKSNARVNMASSPPGVRGHFSAGRSQ